MPENQAVLVLELIQETVAMVKKTGTQAIGTCFSLANTPTASPSSTRRRILLDQPDTRVSSLHHCVTDTRVGVFYSISGIAVTNGNQMESW